MIRFLQAIDPLFPAGGYTLSNGLETYTQLGLVSDGATLLSYLKAQLFLLPFGDLGFAAKAAHGEDFCLLDEICGASKSASEIRLGSEKLCSNFMRALTAIGSYDLVSRYKNEITAKRCSGHYSIAVGLLIRDLSVPVSIALELYCYQILSSIVNHAVKLVPLSQIAGQAALAEAVKSADNAVQQALTINTDELGASGFGFELRAMQHETLPGRLFIS